MKHYSTPVLVLVAGFMLLSLTTYGQDGATTVYYEGKAYIFGGATDIFGKPVPSNQMKTFDPKTDQVSHFQTDNTWPEPRTGHSSCQSQDGSKFYIFGGKNEKGEYLNDLWEFDLRTLFWKKLNPTNNPLNRINQVQVSIGNILYVAGGSTSAGTSLSDVYSIDITNPVAWTAKAPLPEGLQSSGVLTFNGKMIVYGGFLDDYDNTIPGKQMSVNRYAMQYTPGTNEWTMLTSQGERELYDFAWTTGANGDFWVWGGCSYNYDTGNPVIENGIAVWKPLTNTWTTPVATNDLAKTYGGSLVYVPASGMKTTGKGKLYHIGGMQANGTITERIVEYDLETKIFKEVYTPSGIDAPFNPGFTMTISPNPAQNSATIFLTLAKQNKIFISAYDLSGRMVLNGPLSQEYASGTHLITLDISRLAHGMYSIRVATQEQVVTKKLFVQGQ
jgi:N-acetylneuraminic acid mutarotase